MQEGENKFRQTGKRQLGHEGPETKLDNASGKGAMEKNEARKRRWFSDEGGPRTTERANT